MTARVRRVAATTAPLADQQIADMARGLRAVNADMWSIIVRREWAEDIAKATGIRAMTGYKVSLDASARRPLQ